MTIGSAGIQGAVLILALLNLLVLALFAGIALLLVRRRRHRMTPLAYRRMLIGAGCAFLVLAALSVTVLG